MDDEERAQWVKASRELGQVQRAAFDMPPLEEGPETTCATCPNPTATYQVLADGARKAICGACLVRETDELIEARRKGQEP